MQLKFKLESADFAKLSCFGLLAKAEIDQIGHSSG